MIGTEIEGRYRILSKLDEGGTGEVYLAEHMHLRRREALKFLLPSLANESEFSSRFRREARAMNRLSHPNIAAVYDFGRAPDGRFYLAIEYAPGRNLADVISLEGALPLARAIHLLEQLADAIGHAHARGVIHRDLKPANLILVAKRDTDLIKVFDFGLAKIIGPDDERSTSTHGGGLRGTVGYMAPEVLLGENASAPSDIYALGCIGFEILAGRPPFMGRPTDVMEMHVNAPPPSPGAFRISGPIPAAVEQLIVACLAKRPEQRPPASRLVELLANATTNRLDARRSQRRIAVPPALVPPADYVDEEPTSVSGEGGHDTQLDAGRARTMVLPVSDALADYRAGLRRLAEALLDLGSGNAQLGVALAELGRAEVQLDRLDAERADLEAELTTAEQRCREREGLLRFAMGDLRFLRDDRNARQVDDQLAGLGGELTRTLREREGAITAITERQLEIAARTAALEDALLQRCRELDPVAVQTAEDYGTRPEIGAARDQVATTRLMVKIAVGR